MRIGIDAYPLVRDGAGISNYVFNIIKNLEQIDLVNQYFLYSCPGIKLPFTNNPRWHIRIKNGFINKSATLWMQKDACRDLKNDRVDIFWATEQITPINLPANIKLVLNIHDLTWLHYPETMSLHNRLFYKLFFEKSINRANIILTLSHAIADDIKKQYRNIDFGKLKVIYAGLDEDFILLPKENNSEHQNIKYLSSGKKFILSVGTIEPRKNFETLIVAYNLLSNSLKNEYCLLIAGRIGWKNKNVFKLCRDLKLDQNQVKFLGYVSKENLANLYHAASLFVFPSLYEGFGLPLLEAMAFRLPIVCSDIETFREIARDSAFFVNPKEANQVSEAISRVLIDQQIRSGIIENGYLRQKTFSWNKTAYDFLGLFNSI